MMEEAVRLASKADAFVVIGTSMSVYPAAGLINYAPPRAPIYVIDPNVVDVPLTRAVQMIKEKASEGIAILSEKLVKTFVKS